MERGNTDDGVPLVMSEQVGEKMSSFFLTSHLKKLIYNGMLGSGVQKSDSFIHVKYTFISDSIISFYKILNIVLCVVQ